MRAVIKTVLALIVGAFIFVMGNVSMTGVNLSNPPDMALYLVFNGLVLAGVIAALRQV